MDPNHCGADLVGNIHKKCTVAAGTPATAEASLVSACTIEGCAECKNRDVCTKCKVDHVLANETTCTLCGDGKFSTGTNEACKSCITNCKTCTSTT